MGQTTQQIAGTALSAGTGIATAIAAGATLTIPIIGAALGAVTLAIEAILNSGCGNTCVVTSNWANQAADQLQNNIEEYFAIPSPRPQSAQTTAVGNFMSVWNYLVQECSAPSLGTAGQNCISDRQEGACHYQAAPPQFPGQPATGACWNWWNAYHDPIANDPDVISDEAYTALQTTGSSTGTTSTPSTTATVSTASGISSSTMLLMAGAALVLFGMTGGSN